MGELRFMQGNETMTEGAIAAGARFYAGYPITPSTEVAETSSSPPGPRWVGCIYRWKTRSAAWQP